MPNFPQIVFRQNLFLRRKCSFVFFILDESFLPRIYLFLSWEKSSSLLQRFCLRMSLFFDPISAFIFCFNCFVSACSLFLRLSLRKIVFFGGSVVSSSLSSMNPISQEYIFSFLSSGLDCPAAFTIPQIVPTQTRFLQRKCSFVFVILDESFLPRIYLFLSWEKCRSLLHPFCLRMSLFVDPISIFIF